MTFALLHRCRGILSRDLLLRGCFRPSRAPGATSLHLLPVPLYAPTAANSSYEDGCAEIQEGVWRKVSSFHKVEDAYFFFKAQKKNTSSLFENYYTLDRSEFALFFFLQENVRDGGGKVSPIRSIARRSSSR